MSNVVFSFDAQAYGVLAAVDSMIGAFSSLENAVSSMVTSFGSIASQSATMMAGLGSLVENFGALSGSMDQGSTSMSKAGTSANNLAYQLQQLGERAQDAARQHNEMVQQITQQEADLTQTTKEQIAKRTESYDESLQKLVQSHEYATQQMQDQEQQLTLSYEDQIDKRLVALQDPRALQHQQFTLALSQQIDALIATGQGDRAKGLEAQLTAEDASYQNYIRNTIEPAYQFLDKKNYDSHQLALQRLQQRMTKEQATYEEQTAYLKKHYDEELATIETHYQQSERKLEEHLAKENASYAQQAERIAEQRAHLLASGTGGSGGGIGGAAPYGSPPTDQFIALFRQLGINPSTPGGAIAGENALQAWLTGGSYGGVNFGQGYAPRSQMNVQQLWGVITQGMAYGQDPTKNLGGGNLLDVISNLMVNAQIINGKSPGAAFNSILSIFEKAESGNTIGLERQLAALGISPQLLEKYGVQFGGRGGKTIMNPGSVLGALEHIGLSPGFAGQGERQSQITPQGAATRLRDMWTGVTTGIVGNVNDPTSLMARFMVELNRLIMFLQSHRQDIIAFGKTVGESLLGTFDHFVTFLQSAQAHRLLGDIGDAFHHIGDALHWMGQHKDILMLLGGLLAVQVGGKLLGGLAGGVMGLGGGLLSGGPLGMLGGAAQGIMNSGPMGNLMLSMFGALTPGAAAGNMGRGILGSIASRFGGGRGFGQDAGVVKDIIDRLGVSGALTMGGGAVPGYGPLASIGLRAGVSPWAARLGAFMQNPGEASQIMASETGANIGTAGRVAGMAIRAAPGVIASSAGGIASSIGGLLSGGGASMIAGIGPDLAGIGPALLGIAAAAGPILLVVGAIAGLFAVLVMNREKIQPFLTMLGNFFGEKLKEATKAVTQFVAEVQSRLGPAFGPGSLIYKGVMFFASLWMAIWPGIQKIFSGVWSVIEGVIKVVWSIISGIILIGLDLLGGKWGKAWDDIKNLLRGVWDGILSILRGVWSIIVGVVTGALAGIWHIIQSVFGTVWNFISGIFKNIWNGWTDLWSKKIPDALHTAFKWIMDRLGDLGKGITDFFTKTVPNGIAQAFSGIGDILKKAVDFLIDHVLPDPLKGPVHAALGFEQGGYYPGGQVAVVGEAGPELFFSGAAGTVVSNRQIRDALSGSGGGGGGMRPIVITGPVHIHDVQDAEGLYHQINRMSGKYQEHGTRGGNT
ncbi:MAG: hypothetical protein H0X24_05175 [Ktedonobacterales bacterium]|nr:hypothetical protein [Ktedonobacterales bacterium]